MNHCIDYDRDQYITFTRESWNEFQAMLIAYSNLQRIPYEVMLPYHNLEEVK